MQPCEPFLLKSGLIIAHYSTANISGLLGSINNSAAKSRIAAPARCIGLGLGTTECKLIRDSILALGCNYTLNLDFAAKTLAHCLGKVGGSKIGGKCRCIIQSLIEQ